MPTRLLQFGSVQGPGVPTQTPSWHVSVVQASPSLHGAVLLVWRQPPAPSQVSSVQGLLSSQFWVVVAVHVPPWHVSPIVQGLASSQGAVLFTWMQPLTGSQPSSVQGFPSSQVGAAPPTQAPSWQVSLAVQGLPSSQGAVLLLCRQPPAPSQVSSVQGLPSSQMNWPAQTPPWQVSLTVQVLPSSQGAALFVWVQPLAGLQPSSVQALPSLQSGAGPPTQAPARQVSPVVQALPSSQGATLGTFAQTPAVQLSSVQGLPSSQSA